MKASPTLAISSSRDIQSWENALLDWFAGLGAPLIEQELSLGGLRYHHFSAAFELADGRKTTSHGRSQNRRLAAVKCAAEYAERRWMMESYQASIRPGGDPSLFPPRRLWTSNGWAVHRSAELAVSAAFDEALQRHLLLKSFLAHGWAGFHRIQEIQSEGITLHLIASRYRSDGRAAGIVVAKSALYPGIALGYCLAREETLETLAFWEPALYEACDKILTLNGLPVSLDYDPGSWIVAEIKHFLETPFNLAQLGNDPAIAIHEEPRNYEICQYDVSSKWGLDFPLHAAFVYGGNLIPLYHVANLGLGETLYLQQILSRNQISSELPERHPVL